MLDDLPVLQPVDRPRLDVLERCATRGRRDPRQAASVRRARDAAHEDLVVPSEDVLHLELPVLEDLRDVLVHHLCPGQALRHTWRPVVGREVSREVLVELIELAVDPSLFDLAHDLFVPLLVAHGSPPLFRAAAALNAGRPPAACAWPCGSAASTSVAA